MKYYLVLFFLIMSSCVTIHEPITPTKIDWEETNSFEDLGALAMHQCLYSRGGILVFGGVNDRVKLDTFNNSSYIYLASKSLWIPLGQSTKPKLRGQIVGGYNDKFIAFGGVDKKGGWHHKGYELNWEDKTWISTGDSFLDARIKHTMTYIDDKVVVLGGINKLIKKPLNWGFYDFNTKTWKDHIAPKEEKSRVSHIATKLGDDVFIWGALLIIKGLILAT